MYTCEYINTHAVYIYNCTIFPAQGRESLLTEDVMSDEWMKDMKECPLFCPTVEEFRHAFQYIETVRRKCEAVGAGTATHNYITFRLIVYRRD